MRPSRPSGGDGATRKNAGVWILAVSAFYSAIDLSGRTRPLLLRWRAHGGLERTLAVVLGSLSFKALLLFTGVLLAFWPSRARRGTTGS